MLWTKWLVREFVLEFNSIYYLQTESTFDDSTATLDDSKAGGEFYVVDHGGIDPVAAHFVRY